MGRKFLKWVNICTFVLSIPSFVFIMASSNHEVSEIQLLMCAVIIALCCIGVYILKLGDMFEEMKIEDEQNSAQDLERQAEEFAEEERQRRIREFADWNESFNDL